MPRSASTLKSDLSSTNVPTKTVASGGSAQVVTVILNYAGVGYRPIDVITALEGQYGSNKVTSARDAQPPYGTLDLQINP